MKRSIGVTVIAVLSLIGSTLVLLCGVLMVVIATIAPPPSTTEFPIGAATFRLILCLTSLLYILPAIWGIATSIGLFRLSGWARISTIVFSVLLILMAGFAALGSFLLTAMMRGVENGGAQVPPSLGIVMGIFWLGLLAIGIWWLVFFVRPGVKQQFTANGLSLPAAQTAGSLHPAIPTKPERPISFTVIAWFLLLGCCFMPLAAFLRSPAVFLTSMLTGWPAVALYIAYAALNFYIGFGLLRFKPFAREIGIGYLLFMFLNTAVFYFAPGGRARMQVLIDMQETMFPWMRGLRTSQPVNFNSTLAIWFGGGIGSAIILVQLYFLITRKRAYDQAAAAARTA